MALGRRPGTGTALRWMRPPHGKNAGHYMTETSRLLCGKCLWSRGETSRRLHARFYPDCDVDWHGVWDGHHISSATRAGAWFVLTRAGRR